MTSPPCSLCGKPSFVTLHHYKEEAREWLKGHLTEEHGEDTYLCQPCYKKHAHPRLKDPSYQLPLVPIISKVSNPKVSIRGSP